MAPNPIITSVTWPSSPKDTGEQCKTNISYINDGTDGDVFSRIVDSNGTILASYTSSVAAGELSTDSLYFYMPANDITIYAQTGIDSTVTSQKGPKTITLVEEPSPGYWEYHSTYRGINIEAWIPDGTPYRAYFDGSWHQKPTLTAIHAAIDTYIEEPPVDAPDIKIRNLTYPTTPTPGDTVQINMQTKKQGVYPTQAKQLTTQIYIVNKTEIHRQTLQLPRNAYTDITTTWTMPDKTWNLRIETGYNDSLTASANVKMGAGAEIPAIVLLGGLALIAYLVFKR